MTSIIEINTVNINEKLAVFYNHNLLLHMNMYMAITNVEDRNREWLDDIKEWCQKSVWQTKTIAMDRDKWRKFVDASIDTHGT